MCGRFTLTADAKITAEFFGLDPIPGLLPRYNIAPSQRISVAGNRPAGGRGLTSLT